MLIRNAKRRCPNLEVIAIRPDRRSKQERLAAQIPTIKARRVRLPQYALPMSGNSRRASVPHSIRSVRRNPGSCLRPSGLFDIVKLHASCAGPTAGSAHGRGGGGLPLALRLPVSEKFPVSRESGGGLVALPLRYSWPLVRRPGRMPLSNPVLSQAGRGVLGRPRLTHVAQNVTRVL